MTKLLKLFSNTLRELEMLDLKSTSTKSAVILVKCNSNSLIREVPLEHVSTMLVECISLQMKMCMISIELSMLLMISIQSKSKPSQKVFVIQRASTSL